MSSGSRPAAPALAPVSLDPIIRHIAEAQDGAWSAGHVLAAMVLSMIEADLRVMQEHNPRLRAPGKPQAEAPEG